jgi:hypothetical protein
MIDIEKMFAAIREYAAREDYAGTSLTFRAVSQLTVPMHWLEHGDVAYWVSAVNRRNGRANGFLRNYAVKATSAGSYYVQEALNGDAAQAIEWLSGMGVPK